MVWPSIAITSDVSAYQDPYSQDRFEDNCGVYWPFQEQRNIPVECNSDESHTPGTFCVKIVKQGPRGFICKYSKTFLWYIIIYFS